MKTNIYFLSSCSVLFRMRNFSNKSCRENQNTHFMLSDLSTDRAVYEIMRKNKQRAAQATDDNMAHAHCMLDT